MNGLLSLTQRQKELLRLRIRKWDGLVRIFVHPLFEKWHWSPSVYGMEPAHERLITIEKVLGRLLAMPEDKTPPIIIMEEHCYLGYLQKWFTKNPRGKSQSNTYFVATRQNYPTPLHADEPYGSWKQLINTMHDIGVEKILMGGMQFEAWAPGTDWTGKPPYCDRCVGIAL